MREEVWLGERDGRVMSLRSRVLLAFIMVQIVWWKENGEIFITNSYAHLKLEEINNNKPCGTIRLRYDIFPPYYI